MKEKSKNIFKKLVTSLMVMVTVITSLFATSMPVSASTSTLVLDERTDYTYTGVSPITGYSITHNIFILKMDGKKVFCVESGVPANSGDGYIPESYISSKKGLLYKIAYYGYTATNQTHYDYVVTQVMIWEELGDQYQSSSIPNYQAKKAEIMVKVNSHSTVPSWNGQEVNVAIGESLTLTDSNGIFSGMTLESNNTNATVKQDGNKLIITPSSSFKDGTIKFSKFPSSAVGTSIIYEKPNQQSMVDFHLESNVTATIKVKEQMGKVILTKTGEEFKTTMFNQYYSLKGAVYGIYLEDGTKVTTITTDVNGKATSSAIKLGKYYALEETAPAGYVLNTNKIPFELAYAGQAVEITSTDISQVEKEQKGSATLVKEDSKTGATAQGGASLDGAVYELRRTSTDEVVETVTTKAGKATAKNLYLDDYYWIEVKAPEGYVLAKEPVAFKVDGSNDGLIEIRFEDMSQKGIVNFTKTGQTPVGVTTTESDYGTVYEFVFNCRRYILY